MKRALILHGTDGNPIQNWQPWIRAELEDSGYTVFSPNLPNNHRPDREKYDKFLQASGWDFTDNVIVGHSSGSTAVLNLLSSNWLPHVRAVILASTFLNEKLLSTAQWYEPGQFDQLFRGSYDIKAMKQRADRFYFVHGSDDPLCDIEDARELCKQLDATFITIENGGHLSERANVFSLPELARQLRADGLLE